MMKKEIKMNIFDWNPYKGLPFNLHMQRKESVTPTESKKATSNKRVQNNLCQNTAYPAYQAYLPPFVPPDNRPLTEEGKKMLIAESKERKIRERKGYEESAAEVWEEKHREHLKEKREKEKVANEKKAKIEALCSDPEAFWEKMMAGEFTQEEREIFYHETGKWMLTKKEKIRELIRETNEEKSRREWVQNIMETPICMGYRTAEDAHQASIRRQCKENAKEEVMRRVRINRAADEESYFIEAMRRGDGANYEKARLKRRMKAENLTEVELCLAEVGEAMATCRATRKVRTGR